MDGLLPHQITAAQLIAERGRAYLADPPGMAKTRAAIAGVYKAGCRRPLIICPSIVRSHWAREHEGLDIDPGDSAIMSYDQAVRGGMIRMAELIHREKVDAIIVDEAHYCKHANAQRTRIVLGKDGYARRLRHVVPVSGTPLPRNAAEIWTVLASVFPEIVREYKITTQEKWNSLFCVVRPMVVRGQYREKVVGLKNADLLQEILGRVLIRRSFAEVGFSLPPVWWQTLRIDGTPLPLEDSITEGRLLCAIEEGALEAIAADPHVASIRRRLGELKVGPVVEMLRSQLADSEEKVVVFAYHRSVLANLRESLTSFGVAYVDGDTSDRDAQIERFKSDPDCRIFLGQNIACQTGMDGLQYSGARRVILVEPEWLPDCNVQLAARVARLGQKAGNVIVQMVVLAGTLDEAILAQVKRETEMVQQAIGKAGQ